MPDKKETSGEARPCWYGKGYAFFSNTSCEYFPCHPVPAGTDFNCLFCYCPLYMLGPDCGGNFTYLENGCKDCSQCLRPHLRENYGEITQYYQRIQEAMVRRSGEFPPPRQNQPDGGFPKSAPPSGETSSEHGPKE